MSDNQNIPLFVWIVGAVVLVIIVGYALFSKQQVQEIEFPGGRAKFGPKMNDEAFSFFISYTRDEHVIKGDAVVYLAGAGEVNLHVDQNSPFHTLTKTVPKPGTYTYRIEQTQVSSVFSGTDSRTLVPVTFQMSGEGRIEVHPGASFILTPVLELQSSGRPAVWTTRLEEIKSEEDRRRMEEESIRLLEEELGLK